MGLRTSRPRIPHCRIRCGLSTAGYGVDSPLPGTSRFTASGNSGIQRTSGQEREGREEVLLLLLLHLASIRLHCCNQGSRCLPLLASSPSP